MPNQDKAIILAEEIKDLNEQIMNLKASVNDKADELKYNVCPHVNETTSYDFISGTYYDRAIYITRYTCDLCGRVREERTTGGYG